MAKTKTKSAADQPGLLAQLGNIVNGHAASPWRALAAVKEAVGPELEELLEWLPRPAADPALEDRRERLRELHRQANEIASAFMSRVEDAGDARRAVAQAILAGDAGALEQAERRLLDQTSAAQRVRVRLEGLAAAIEVLEAEQREVWETITPDAGRQYHETAAALRGLLATIHALQGVVDQAASRVDQLYHAAFHEPAVGLGLGGEWRALLRQLERQHARDDERARAAVS